jgi:FeS assembly SUF system protein
MNLSQTTVVDYTKTGRSFMNPQTVSLETSRINKQPEQAAPLAAVVEPPAPIPATPLTSAQLEQLKQQLIEALCSCFDPEIPVNIYELGLIYDIDLSPLGAVAIRMTLTSPACPAAGSLPGDVKTRLLRVPGVTTAKVDVVWDPPWDKDRMSEAAKLQLGIDD